MARKNKVPEGIVSLHNRIVDKQKEIRSPEVLRLVTKYIAELRFVGVSEGLEIGGRPAKLLYIDGDSWRNACRILKSSAAPNFVIWEEEDFFSHLDSLVSALVRPKTGQGPPDKSH